MAAGRKKLRANRENGPGSSGSKSEGGKRKTNQNIAKHGRLARSLMPNPPKLKEDQDRHNQLVECLYKKFKPNGILEEHLVCKIANCSWQHYRILLIEEARIAGKLVIPADTYDERIMRYEQHLNEQQNWAVETLSLLQKHRNFMAASKRRRTSPKATKQSHIPHNPTPDKIFGDDIVTIGPDGQISGNLIIPDLENPEDGEP